MLPGLVNDCNNGNAKVSNAPQCRAHLHGRSGVKAGSWFIQEQHSGVGYHFDSNIHTLQERRERESEVRTKKGVGGRQIGR